MTNARPILFSPPMIRALLEGRKTQTRRIIKPQPQPNDGKGLHPVRPYHTPQGKWTWVLAATGHGDGTSGEYCPYGQAGDLLWVRESYAPKRVDGSPHVPLYRADHPTDDRVPGQYGRPWKPSIHMPRYASRLSLEITDVRVQRLQDISEEDAIAEGIQVDECGHTVHEGDDIAWGSAKGAFAELWESIHGDGSWAANPWVWVLAFNVHHGNVDKLLSERAA